MELQIRKPKTELSQETRDGAKILLENSRVLRDLSVDYIAALVTIAEGDAEDLTSQYLVPESIVTGLRRAYKL